MRVDGDPIDLQGDHMWHLVFHKSACWKLHRSQPGLYHSRRYSAFFRDDFMAGDANHLGGGNDDPRAMRRKKLLRSEEGGAVAVEAAITLSALLFLLLGAIQFGLAYFAWNTMLLAAEEAGRYAMLFHAFPNNPPGCADTLPNCAIAWANQNFGNIFPVTAGTNATNCPSGMTFTATYTFNIVTPISLTRYVCVPLI
ncbi:MAG TPA: TadE/TadG family type IV pilus assembly protein [Steroidobacteraceae bacterium]|nr:TadE/TadG family type IV pilus assembly protein [Steroidobacteraceae bacterium]